MFRAGCSNGVAERSHVVESAKPGKPPPAEPREARREGAGGAQRRATRFAAGGATRPLDAKPAGGECELPSKSSRGTRPARPAGGGTNAFCFPSLVAPAPPRLPELSVTRLRAGAAQSFSTMQSARGTRNKKQSLPASQTFRFNLPVSAHSGVSAIVRVRRKKRFSPPRPSPSRGGRGIPVGAAPLRANLFRLLFRSLGKVAPAEQKTNNYCLQRITSKTSMPLRSKY